MFVAELRCRCPLSSGRVFRVGKFDVAICDSFETGVFWN